MKFQHLRFAFCNEISPSSSSPSASSPPSSSPSLTMSCKRLRPLAPRKLTCTDGTNIITDLDLRCFESPKASKCTEVQNQDASPSGGTRWNPTQDQIRMLEELYKSGMRTPNAQQIERITVELGKYGRIEGKNVFYWFQNHKARERQRQKRSNALLTLDAASLSLFSSAQVESEEAKWFDIGTSKRKCRSWEDAGINKDEGDGTLELFPLHPERTGEESSSKNGY